MILERPEEPGKKYALALTVLVHLALVAFLFFGVQWKRSKPEVYEVELWAPSPRPATQVAAAPSAATRTGSQAAAQATSPSRNPRSSRHRRKSRIS